MISIIVCSRREHDFRKLKSNIEKTIGSHFEIIRINNTNNQYNIFQAYNEGVRRSKGDILCFCHEDIFFHSANWGKNVLRHFQDEKLGAIGVAGCSALPKVPAPWWNSGSLNQQLKNIIQHYNNSSDSNIKNQNGISISKDYNNPGNLKIQPVVAVDGVWFCIRKELFKIISFDEKTYPGFHFYDIDICLQVLTSFHSVKVAVVYDVLIEHLSQGTLNKDWVLALIAFNQKWLEKKPIFSTQDKRCISNVYQYEINNLLYFSNRMRDVGFSDDDIKQIIKKYLKHLGKQHRRVGNYMYLRCWSIFGFHFTNCSFSLLRHIIGFFYRPLVKIKLDL